MQLGTQSLQMWEKSCLHLPSPWSHVCELCFCLFLGSAMRVHWLNLENAITLYRGTVPFQYFNFPSITMHKDFCVEMLLQFLMQTDHVPARVWPLYQIFCLVRLMSPGHLTLWNSCRKAGFSWCCIHITSIIFLNRSEELEGLSCLFPVLKHSRFCFHPLMPTKLKHKKPRH